MIGDWKVKKLTQVFDFKGGSQPPKSVFKFEPEQGYVRMLQIRDFSRDDKAVYIPEESSSRRCESNDILIGRYGASVGKICTGKAGAYNVALMKVTPIIQELDSKYSYYYFNSNLFQKSLLAISSRGAQNGFNVDNLSTFDFLLPPLPEQKRIVAILDQAFEAIDQAQANIERNIKNAEELFQSKLNEVFGQSGEGWEEKSLGEIGKVSMCKRIFKDQTFSSGDIPFYKIGTFGKTPNAFISNDIYTEYRSKYSFPKTGDVLISASGTIGRRVRYDGEPAYFQDSNIVWIDNHEKEVSNDYLYFFYGICDWQPSKGATISRLYNSDLRRIKIRFPSLDKQQYLVKMFEELSFQIEEGGIKYEKKVEGLAELKKSLLQKAFSGELTEKEVVV